jgi:hypothetical protein
MFVKANILAVFPSLKSNRNKCQRNATKEPKPGSFPPIVSTKTGQETWFKRKAQYHPETGCIGGKFVPTLWTKSPLHNTCPPCVPSFWAGLLGGLSSLLNNGCCSTEYHRSTYCYRLWQSIAYLANAFHFYDHNMSHNLDHYWSKQIYSLTAFNNSAQLHLCTLSPQAFQWI